jgi:hypothetical protein
MFDAFPCVASLYLKLRTFTKADRFAALLDCRFGLELGAFSFLSNRLIVKSQKLTTKSQQLSLPSGAASLARQRKYYPKSREESQIMTIRRCVTWGRRGIMENMLDKAVTELGKETLPCPRGEWRHFSPP